MHQRVTGDCAARTVATRAAPRAATRLVHSASVNYRGPQTETACRYVLSVTVGTVSVEQPCASLEAARGAFELFKAREADNRDAHGGIYDRETRGYGGTLWRGGPKPQPLIGPADIYAKLIASGQPVSIIGPNYSADFNTALHGRGEGK